MDIERDVKIYLKTFFFTIKYFNGNFFKLKINKFCHPNNNNVQNDRSEKVNIYNK